MIDGAVDVVVGLACLQFPFVHDGRQDRVVGDIARVDPLGDQGRGLASDGGKAGKNHFVDGHGCAACPAKETGLTILAGWVRDGQNFVVGALVA